MDCFKTNPADIKLLVNSLEKVVVLIGGPSMCKGIVKSINVIKNKDHSESKSVKRNVYEDFRMIYDRGQYCDDVEKLFNDIEKILKKYFPHT